MELVESVEAVTSLTLTPRWLFSRAPLILRRTDSPLVPDYFLPVKPRSL